MKNELQVWKKLKAGNRDAFELLFHTYYNDLYVYGVKFCGDRFLVEDEIQSLFLKIWTNRKKLGDVRAVKTYLWTALRRNLLTASERKQREYTNLENHDFQAGFSLSIEEFIIRNEETELLKEELKKALEILSPKQKETLYLKFYEGMSYEEIEQIMGVNYQVARNYLYQGLQKIRKQFPEESIALLLFMLMCIHP